jgi:hypothetical protein
MNETAVMASENTIRAAQMLLRELTGQPRERVSYLKSCAEGSRIPWTCCELAARQLGIVKERLWSTLEKTPKWYWRLLLDSRHNTPRKRTGRDIATAQKSWVTVTDADEQFRLFGRFGRP